MLCDVQLGLDVPSAVIRELFEEWDVDQSECITFKEISKTLNSKAIIKPLSHVDLDESSGAPPVAEQLKMALSENAVTVIRLFKCWDGNGDGNLSRTEFQAGLLALGLNVPQVALYKLFSEWDKDHSGEISLRELTSVLNCTSAMNELRHLLNARNERLTAAFRRWDLNNDGELSQAEFDTAMQECGLAGSATQLQALFDSIDTDSSGTISYREFNKALRRDPEKAAQDAKQRRENKESIASFNSREVLVDVEKLRNELRNEAKAFGQRIQAIDDELRGNAEEQRSVRADPRLRWKWAKEEQARREQAARRTFEKNSLHMRLRLRGTELEPHHYAGKLSLQKVETPSPSRTVTRHGRLPSVLEAKSEDMPSTTDILSLHRRLRHAPARRHCHVFMQPIPSPKWSKSELLEMATSPGRMKLCYSTKAKQRPPSNEQGWSTGALLSPMNAAPRKKSMTSSQSMPSLPLRTGVRLLPSSGSSHDHACLLRVSIKVL